MTQPFVSVIIVNYNAGARLEKCLAHLTAQTFDDFETIVVDNASSDGSAAAVARSERPARLIEAGANLGFAAANNLAANEARGTWLAFLNPDAYAAPDWLAAFRRACDAYPDVAAFGSAQLDAADPSRLDGAGDVCHAFGLHYRGWFGWPTSSLPEDGECFSPCAAAAFYRRETFLALGGFDERFFCYAEDMDLGFRLRLTGGRAVQLKDARVYHEGSGVTGRASDFAVYHGARNRLWMYYKNLPLTAFLCAAPFHVAVNLALLIRWGAAGRLGAYWRGLRDGVAGFKTLREARREIAATRRLSPLAAARLLTWSPVRLLRRAGDLRPVASRRDS